MLSTICFIIITVALYCVYQDIKHIEARAETLEKDYIKLGLLVNTVIQRVDNLETYRKQSVTSKTKLRSSHKPRPLGNVK